MRIAIIGAGAMGCLYGGYLARKNKHEVWLYDVVGEQVNYISRKGLSIVSPGESIMSYPRATNNINDIKAADLVIICVKAYHTAEAAMAAEIVGKPGALIITLQNGLGNAEKLAEILGPERIVVGTSSMGAVTLEPGHIMHRGVRRTHLAAWQGCSDAGLNRIKEIFSDAELPVVLQDNSLSLLWTKVAIHSGINAVTAVTRVTNGQLFEIPNALRLAEMAVNEAVNVAQAAGIKLLYSDCVAEMREFAESLREHRSSMLQDVTHRSKTEIDAINGKVVEEGKRLGIPVCVNETLVLALNTIETLYSASGK